LKKLFSAGEISSNMRLKWNAIKGKGKAVIEAAGGTVEIVK